VSVGHVAGASTLGGSATPYAFGGRLSSVFPSQVIIDVTELCNLACTHCPHPAFKKSEHYAGRTLDPALSAKAIREVAGAGGVVQQVRFTSEGEPLLHQSIFAILDDAVTHSGTFVSMTTNGVLLTPDRIERLLATGIHLVDISIDAFTAATYARIRVRGDLSVTRGNVERLIERARATTSSTRIVVSYIEQPDNASETVAFERFWRQAGADDVAVRRLHSAAGAVIPVADLLRRRAAATLRRPCVYPWERIVLTPRGTLAFCPADWTHGSTLADYRTTRIAELWSSAQYAALRRAHLTNDYEAHGFCGQCPDWQETRWPNDGPSYATLVERLREGA
jgi:pyruvate-formate lyase-activating enzyme